MMDFNIHGMWKKEKNRSENKKNDSNGYLVSNRDLDMMATKIIYLLSHPEEARRLGKNGKAFSQNFLPGSVKAMWMEALRGK